MAALPPQELRQSLRIRLLTGSRSGLQLLQREPAGQSMKLASDVWYLLLELGDAGATFNMQVQHHLTLNLTFNVTGQGCVV